MDVKTAIEEIDKFHGFSKEGNDACDMAIEALEKQIPKKPEFVSLLRTWTHKEKCPVCGAVFTAYEKYGKSPKYCSNCGQAFDVFVDEESEEFEIIECGR